jgi:hypothetical protein
VCPRVRQRGLTREEQAGLLGELAVMERAAAAIGFAPAVSAWCGPLGRIHDFEGAGVAIEVKATIGISHHIRISRLDQLDSEGLSSLVLARARFVEAADGHSLSEVIGTLRNRLAQGHPSAADEFAEKLMRAGYLDADAEVYGSTRTALQDFHGFRISGEFPRLIGAIMPPAIVDAAYSLDERQLGSFRIDEREWQGMLRRMGGA